MQLRYDDILQYERICAETNELYCFVDLARNVLALWEREGCPDDMDDETMLLWGSLAGISVFKLKERQAKGHIRHIPRTTQEQKIYNKIRSSTDKKKKAMLAKWLKTG